MTTRFSTRSIHNGGGAAEAAITKAFAQTFSLQQRYDIEAFQKIRYMLPHHLIEQYINGAGASPLLTDAQGGSLERNVAVCKKADIIPIPIIRGKYCHLRFKAPELAALFDRIRALIPTYHFFLEHLTPEEQSQLTHERKAGQYYFTILNKTSPENLERLAETLREIGEKEARARGR